jgi:hypothetical protein
MSDARNINAIRSNTHNSKYAQYILEHRHTYRTKEETFGTLKTGGRGEEDHV